MQLAEDRADDVAGGSNVHLNQSGAYDAIRCELQKRKKTLRERCVELLLTISDSESLRCDAMDFGEQLLVARAEVALQSLLRKESSEQLNAK